MILYDEQLGCKEEVRIGSLLYGKRYTEIRLSEGDIIHLLYATHLDDYLRHLLHGFRPPRAQS